MRGSSLRSQNDRQMQKQIPVGWQTEKITATTVRVTATQQDAELRLLEVVGGAYGDEVWP